VRQNSDTEGQPDEGFSDTLSETIVTFRALQSSSLALGVGKHVVRMEPSHLDHLADPFRAGTGT
jgi:hypothetical protein